jgi:hypothetical protein
MQLMRVKEITKWETEYPIAELLSCCGFFLVYLIEEAVLAFIPGAGHGHGHAPPPTENGIINNL